LQSYLLNIEEGDLIAIFKICGFYNDKKGVFLLAAFSTWVAATFESCKQQSAQLQNEIKTTKEAIKKKKRKLEVLRSERDCLAESGE
jgi:endonuclease III-like uncharacterized protein